MKEAPPPPPTPEPGGPVSISCFFQVGDVFSIGGGGGGGELGAIKLGKLNHSLHSLCCDHWGAARAQVRSYRERGGVNTRSSQRSDDRDADGEVGEN